MRNWEKFAKACYEQNSAGELKACLFRDEADETDCKQWNITPNEWRCAIGEAISRKIDEVEFKNSVRSMEEMILEGKEVER